MKKINKIVAGMMVIGMGASAFSAIPMQNLNTVNAEVNNYFSVAGFNTSLEIGDELTLPSVEGLSRVVIDPKGRELTIEDNKLLATVIGTYTVRYIKDIEDSVGKAIQEYKVVVTGEKPTLKFATNSSRIIPETIKTNYSKKIVLPVPEVLDRNGEKIENADVVVEINTPSQEDDKITVTNAQLTAENGYELETAVEGTYVIKYIYKRDGKELASKVFTVESQSNYNVERTLTHSLNSTMPTFINLGAKVTLPTVTVKDSNGNEVSAYYSIKAVNIESGTEYTVDDEEHTFVPMKTGSYRITYTIKDFFNSKLEGAVNDNTFNYTIDSCSDTVAPVAQAVNNYTKTVVDGTVVKVAVADIVDAKTNVVSKVYVTGTSTETVTFPAIFATDDYEVQEKDGYYNYDTSKLTFTRTLKKSNGQVVKTWESTEQEVVNENESVSYDFKAADAGNYKIEYTVKDSAGNSKSTTYAFEVVKYEDFAEVDNSAPTITYEDFDIIHARAGQKISFKKPTVVDYVNNDADEKVVGDTRVETHTYYYFDEDVANKVEIEEDKNNSDNLAFTLPKDLSGKGKVTIITYAKDDVNPQTSKTYEITIIGGNDAVAPTTASELTLKVNNELVSGLVDEGSTVSISEITFADKDDDAQDNEYFSAEFSVRYFKDENDKNGTKVSLSNLVTVHNANKTITLKDARFEANNAGTYVVSVVGKDLAGNTFVKYATVNVKKVSNPYLSDITKNSYNVEIGETILLPNVKVLNATDENAKPSIKIESQTGYTLVGNEFTATEKGDYEVIYSYTEGEKTVSETVKIHAEDTTKPTIDLDFSCPKVAKLNEVVVLPDFVASDASGINFEETKVTVKNKNGNTVTVEHTENGWEFTPTENGAYVATYKAVDNTGLVYEEEHTVKCGDVTAPTITIGNEAVNKPGSKKVGDKLELDLNSITISDAGDSRFTIEENGETREITFKEAMAEDSELKDNVKVKLYDPNNNLVSLTTEDDAEYYELTEQGTYKIVYYAKDAGGNETTDSIYSHSFTVNAKTTTAGISTQTLGIILIVASLLLLGGVIVYFFATRKVVRRQKNNKAE